MSDRLTFLDMLYLPPHKNISALLMLLVTSNDSFPFEFLPLLYLQKGKFIFLIYSYHHHVNMHTWHRESETDESLYCCCTYCLRASVCACACVRQPNNLGGIMYLYQSAAVHTLYRVLSKNLMLRILTVKKHKNTALKLINNLF